MKHVFVSYSRDDIEIVEKVLAATKGPDLKFWLDRDIPTGTPWRSRIAEEIRNADVFMILLSPSSVASEEVRRELAVAAKARKPICPVMITQFDDFKELEYQLAELQIVDLVKSFVSGTQGLAKDLRTLSDAGSPSPALPDTHFTDMHGRPNFTGRRLVKILSDPALVIEQKADACLKIYRELYEPRRPLVGLLPRLPLGDPTREASLALEEKEFEEFKNQVMMVMATVDKSAQPSLIFALERKRWEIRTAEISRTSGDISKAVRDLVGDHPLDLSDIFGKDRKT